MAVSRPYGGLKGVGNPRGPCRYGPYDRPRGFRIHSFLPSLAFTISMIPGFCTDGTYRIPVSGSKPAPFQVVDIVPIRWMVPLVPPKSGSRTEGGMKRDKKRISFSNAMPHVSGGHLRGFAECGDVTVCVLC